MESLKYLIDNICANFTVESMSSLVKTQLGQGPCTIGDIAREIERRDRSLDIKSAQKLAEAAVEGLAQSGDVSVEGAYVRPAGRT